jgi:hypothetical protein
MLLSATTGVLALSNGEIPLTNYGLGSWRHTGLAAQHYPCATTEDR